MKLLEVYAITYGWTTVSAVQTSSPVGWLASSPFRTMLAQVVLFFDSEKFEHFHRINSDSSPKAEARSLPTLEDHMVFRTLLRRLTPALLGLALLAPQAESQAVDLQLSLLVDVSGSVNATEYGIQMNGYVQAFQSAAIHAAILASPNGIAVNMIHWATSATQVVAWTHLTSAAQANAFAAVLAATSRSGIVGSLTYIGAAINFGVASIAGNSFTSSRLVIDISGDGTNSGGASLATAVSNAELAGVTINGIAIGAASLLTYYQDNVITSDGFALGASGFADFAVAMERKLEAEIIGTDPTVVPEPATMILLATGLLGMGAVRMRRRRKGSA